ncbi:MAG: hypothetical protein Q9183_003013 [Haloplaca sp. 2 TL-2023]
MVEPSDDSGLVNPLRPSARTVHASRSLFDEGSHRPNAVNDIPSHNGPNRTISGGPGVNHRDRNDHVITIDPAPSHEYSEKAAPGSVPGAPPPTENVHGEEPTALESGIKPTLLIRFCRVCKGILLASWINVLLVFVPVAIAVEVAGVDLTIVFAMNAIAIVPLAGLLSYATQSVASEMGDTIGALMNITFGNAVELIIFIALVKDEIRIVQASLLGSLLANLLLILGMCFLFGGLRYREQTAFHASFSENREADRAVLKILLIVYVLYLLFQLKSHAYLYKSTPQHIIDEEAVPGILTDMLHSSSSSSSNTSSGSSDTDGSSRSHSTAKRIKRVLRGRRRRKSSASSISKDATSAQTTLRTSSANTFGHTLENSDLTVVEVPHGSSECISPQAKAIASGDEADTDGESRDHYHRHPDKTIKSRDFESDKRSPAAGSSKAASERRLKKGRKLDNRGGHRGEQAETDNPHVEGHGQGSGRDKVEQIPLRPVLPTEDSSRRPFGKQGISNVLPAMPAMPRMLHTTVFSAANPTGLPNIGNVPSINGNRPHRSNSLPGRLHRIDGGASSPTAVPNVPYAGHATAIRPHLDAKDGQDHEKHLSRTSAILLLLTSTALVAVCAEFLVGSIDHLVDNTGVSSAFIGLIVLPIVGNAAEHVAAVTMDLAIGIAVGSSIQMALFVTPVVVLLGWILQKDMSLYFSLFETVSLFVSAFIISKLCSIMVADGFMLNGFADFLILDGKTNYLEGALLIAAYVIIALAAFFYPDARSQSSLGGAEEDMKLLRML